MALAETPAQATASHVSDVAYAVAAAAPRASAVDGVLSFDDSDTADPDHGDGAVFYRFGTLALHGADAERTMQFDGLLPFAYTQLRTAASWPALHSTVQRVVPGVRRDALVDATVLLGWTSAAVSFEGGYRRYLVKLATGDQLDRLAVDLSGPYATLSLRF